MDRVNRARVLLEQALAKQKGVPLEDLPPIPVDYRKNKGIETYAGNYNYRAINELLSKQDARDWDEVADNWVKRVESGVEGHVDIDEESYLQLKSSFANEILRPAIALEEELKINPSPYTDEIKKNPFSYSDIWEGVEDIEDGAKYTVDVFGAKTDQRYKLFPPQRRTASVVSALAPSLHAVPRLTYAKNPLYRGMHFTEAGRQQFLEWLEKDGVNRRFTSFSLSPEIANGFLSRKGEDYGLLFNVSRSADVEQNVAHPYWAFNKHEGELIYLPGTRFEVKDIEPLNDKITRIEVLPRYTDLSAYDLKAQKYSEDFLAMEKARLLEDRLAQMQSALALDVLRFKKLTRYSPSATAHHLASSSANEIPF